MWMLLVAVALVALGAFAATQYNKMSDGSEKKEKFETEKADADDEENAEIDSVASAYMRIKGKAPLPSDVRRVMKTMRRLNVSSPDEVIRQEMGKERMDSSAPAADDSEDEDNEEEEPQPPAPPPRQVKPPAPKQRIDPVQESVMMKRIEDELETIVNKIDGMLEEIQAAKNRRVNGPLQDDAVETFVPYFPV